jgi:hypothetical protein
MNYVTRGKFVPEGRKKVTGNRLQETGEAKKEKEDGAGKVESEI